MPLGRFRITALDHHEAAHRRKVVAQTDPACSFAEELCHVPYRAGSSACVHHHAGYQTWLVSFKWSIKPAASVSQEQLLRCSSIRIRARGEVEAPRWGRPPDRGYDFQRRGGAGRSEFAARHTEEVGARAARCQRSTACIQCYKASDRAAHRESGYLVVWDGLRKAASQRLHMDEQVSCLLRVGAIGSSNLA